MMTAMIRSDSKGIQAELAGMPASYASRLRLLIKLAIRLGLYDIAEDLRKRK